jgi:glycosyltransferase involved in cell wall biosynthesis
MTIKNIVSIVTRTRRRPAFLRRALQSVAAQATGGNLSLEWIVVNDDVTNADVEAAVADARQIGLSVRLVDTMTEAGAGRATAANVGVRASSGWAYLLHDDDDTLSPHAVRRLSERLERSPWCTACACGVTELSESEKNGRMEEVERSVMFERALPLSLQESAYRNPLPPIGLLVRRSSFDEINGYDEGLPVLEDWDFLLKLNFLGEVDCFTDQLAYHHVREAVGDDANSGPELHLRWGVILRNRMLRNDISAGRVGLSASANIHDRLTSERLASTLGTISSIARWLGLRR